MKSNTVPGPRIVLLMGDGKGKTTSALGMVLRAAGHGIQVAVIQFIKSRSDTGEVRALSQLQGVEILPCGLGFVPPPDRTVEFEKHRNAAEDALNLAKEKLAEPGLSMLVLDEVCNAIHLGLVAEADVLSLLDQARADQILILTGRNAPAGLAARADTVSRIECVKHALSGGRPAQNGVES